MILANGGGVKFKSSSLPFIPRCHSRKATICSSPRLWRFRMTSHFSGRLIFDRNLPHDRPGLLRKIHGRADHDHGFNSIRFHRCQVEKNVPAHAEADCSRTIKFVEHSDAVDLRPSRFHACSMAVRA